MTPSVSLYLFTLGLAGGMVLLVLTAARRLSPPWLRWSLIGLGLFMVSRYVTLALFTVPDAPARFWALRRCWFATSLGLPWAGVVAVDQLLRHPAMTPKKLLAWFSPFLAAYGAVILLGDGTAARDPLGGWTFHLASGWRMWLTATHGLFVCGFLAIALRLMIKIPSRHIRTALAGLALGYLALSADGLRLARGGWSLRPYLYSELFMLLALWYAFETATELQSSR